MNIFLLVFAVFYLAERVVDFGLTMLNLNHIRKHEKEVPAYFREKITHAQYQKSIAYNREKAWFGIISSWIEVPIFWGLLLSGFFGRVDGWVRSFQAGSILTGLFFFALTMGLFFVISLPFSLYETFWIEQKYGFNRMTWRTWAMDLVKGIILVDFDWRSCPGWRSVVDGSFHRAGLVDLGMGHAGRGTVCPSGDLSGGHCAVIQPSHASSGRESSRANPRANEKGGFQNLWNFYDGWIQKINPLQRLFCRNREISTHHPV